MNPFIGYRPTPERFRQSYAPERHPEPQSPQSLLTQLPFPARGRNVQRNAAREVNLAQTMSRKLLYVYIAWSILELAGTITVLALTWNKPCRQPLQLWIGVHSARLLYYLPTYFKRLRGTPETAEDIRRKSWISLLHFTWFIMGQSWFFEATSCRQTNPILYYWTMAMVISTYLVMLAPILLLLGLCFCLPCVLIFLRWFTPSTGAQEDEIVQLPERPFDPTRYRRGVPNEQVEEHEVIPEPEHISPRPSPRHVGREDIEMAVPSPSAPPLSPQVARHEPPVAVPEREIHPAHYVEPEDHPSCAICMDDFKAGDRLRTLPCKHDFHKSCIDRWLTINSTCPMCRNSIYHRPENN